MQPFHAPLTGHTTKLACVQHTQVERPATLAWWSSAEQMTINSEITSSIKAQ